MVEIVFLGTGSGVPTPKRNHAAIWMRHEGECMLFDCGEGTQKQLIKAGLNFMKIDRIFITHWHADHWAGIISLLLTMNLECRKRPLHIYGPEAERFVRDIQDLGYWGVGFRLVPVEVPYEGDGISTVEETDELVFTSVPVLHSVPAVAYALKVKDRINVDIKKAEKLYGIKQGPLVGKLKEAGEVTVGGKKVTLDDVGYVKKGQKIVYSGDTAPCEGIVRLAAGADVLIHDTTFTEEVEDRKHTGAKEAAVIAKKAGVGKLMLTHFSRRYADVSELEKEARKTFKDSFAAEDFMRIEV
ncbi:MAG: ribonuclease Z [Candidatus Aenigmatarchaeota archaeon]